METLEIDSQLEGLVEPITRAATSRSCVVLLQCWWRIPWFALLPFHMHLRWVGRIEAIPLTPRIGFAPFFESDSFIACTPLYRLDEVVKRRTEARVSRARKRSFPDDLVLQDWESKAAKRLTKLGLLALPGASFVALDQVTPEGETIHGHRKVLGQMAARGGLRPCILVPSKRATSFRSARAFGDLDLLFVNAQGLRGRRTISALQAMLRCCIGAVPTVVLTSGPTDFLRLFEEDVAPEIHLSFLGQLQAATSVGVTPVGRDRPSVDREFEFATEGIEERAPALGGLVKSARAVWWAARQSLCQPAAEPVGIQRFLAAHDRALNQMPLEAPLLTGLRELLLREIANRELKAERLKAVIDVILTVPCGSDTLVLVRNQVEADHLKEKLAQELGLVQEALPELGVHIVGAKAYWPDHSFGAAIAAGYFGNQTIDVLLASRAKQLQLILDPIETRAAWYQLHKAADLVKSAGALEAAAALGAMAGELSRHGAAFGDVIQLSLAPTNLGVIGLNDEIERGGPPSPHHALILFTDGSSIEVSLHAHFEVIREAGKRLKTLEAHALEPGDQVVVLREDSRSLFSEKLLDALDHGPLAQQAEKRATWLSVVRSVCAARRLTAQVIAQTMEDRGCTVDLATVRTWLRLDHAQEAAVPDRPDRFLAFAAALGIVLQREVLLDLYAGIHACRVNHRKFGRELARAVRAAYLGRLDATTLSKIERDWGMSARQLVEAARVAVVDELILPPDVQDADC